MSAGPADPAARDGAEEASLEAWVDAHGGSMLRYATARTGDAAAAEDLVQETLLDAWRTRDRFGGRSTRRTWLFGILRHKLLDHLRARGRRRDAEARLEQLAESRFDADGKWASPVGPLPRGDADALRAALAGCLDRLPPRAAEAFLLVERHDVPAGHVAERLGVEPPAVHALLYRARVALRECLERRGVTD